jgi:hypothetical protein
MVLGAMRRFKQEGLKDLPLLSGQIYRAAPPLMALLHILP